MERGRRRTTHRNITTHTTHNATANHGWLASQPGYLTAVVPPPLLSLEKLGGGSLCHEEKARGGWLLLFFFSSLLLGLTGC